MTTYYQQLNDITEYKIILAETGKTIGIKSMIKYYGVLSYLVLKKHYPTIQTYLGETFASFIGIKEFAMAPLERTPNSVTFKYLTRVPLEFVLHIDDHPCIIADHENDLADQEKDLLYELIRYLDCHPGLFRYVSKHEAKIGSAEYYAAKFRDVFSGKEIVLFKSLLNSIFEELKKMSKTEFRSIQENIYKETINAFNHLKSQEALNILIHNYCHDKLLLPLKGHFRGQRIPIKGRIKIQEITSLECMHNEQ